MSQKNWRPEIEECRFVLEEMVKINTCQPEGNEKDLVAWIQEQLPEGTSCKVLDHGNNRGSLIVQIGDGSKKGGLAFVGHIDTVACGELSAWKYPPHDAAMEGKIMYGRGTSDMKGGDAAMLLLLKQLLKEEALLNCPIYFCFTADEENGGMGICAIAESKELDEVKQMIICEPSDEQISICEKGALWLRFVARGKGSHASRPDLGINAVEYAYHLADRIRDCVESFPAHPVLGSATASITSFNGGIMPNMIPSSSEMIMDIRTVPGVDHNEILDRAKNEIHKMEESFPGLSFSVEVLNNRSAVGTSEENSMVQAFVDLAKEEGLSEKVRGTYFYTDASQIIPQMGIPFIIAGPGDDKLAHCTDEHIALDSVARFASMYYRYVKQNLCE